MKVYFVRHGRSKGNELMIHQDSNDELSEKGINQANSLSKRFANIEIDLIITSPFIRAKQTAKIINANINKPIIESDLFIEIKRPTEIENLHILDKKALEAKRQILENYHDPSYKFSDEETFFELRNRAKRALSYLTNRKDENILVVTHGEFIRCMFGLIIMEDDFNSHSLVKLDRTLVGKNTGITLCEFKDKWSVITWNDIAHLG